MSRSGPSTDLEFGPAWAVRLVMGGLPWLIGLPILAFVLCYALTQWRMVYSADMTLRPQGGSSSAGRLGGLAAQFGVVLPGGGTGDPVRFHAQLISSREVLTPVVQAHYEIGNGSPGGTFLDLYQVRGHDAEDRLRRGVERLRQLISVDADIQAGLITVKVRTRWPALTLAVAQRLLDAVNAANVRRQQAAATAEADFMSVRLEAARAQLDSSERTLELFQVQNRSYQNSPALSLEAQRLQRAIDLRQQVYVSLAQSYEQARLEAVRNTPTVVVVDRPEGSVREAGRPVRDGAVWAVTTGGLILLVLLCKDAIGRFRQRHRDEFSSITTDLTRILPGRWRSGAP